MRIVIAKVSNSDTYHTFIFRIGDNINSSRIQVRGGAAAFRQWGPDFLFTSFTACSPNFILSGGNSIVLPPQPHLSGGKLPPLPYGGAAHDSGDSTDKRCGDSTDSTTRLKVLIFWSTHLSQSNQI